MAAMSPATSLVSSDGPVAADEFFPTGGRERTTLQEAAPSGKSSEGAKEGRGGGGAIGGGGGGGGGGIVDTETSELFLSLLLLFIPLQYR